MDVLDLGNEIQQRTSLSIQTRSRALVQDGELVRFDTQSRLRFQYDFESADGTKIQIRLKLNSKFSEVDNGTDNAQSLKVRAKLKVTVVQEQVNAGVSPLLDQGGISDDVRGVIEQALGLFQQLTDAASSAFDTNDPLDGDSLITNLVDAFNGLADTILNSFFGLPDADAVESTGLPDANSNPETPTVEGLPPVSEPAPESVAEATPTPDATAEPTMEETPLEKTPEVESNSTAQVPLADSESAPAPLGQVVMIRLRAQVIQSLTSLAGVFNSPGDDTANPTSILAPADVAQFYSQQLSVKLIAHLGTAWDGSV